MIALIDCFRRIRFANLGDGRGPLMWLYSTVSLLELNLSGELYIVSSSNSEYNSRDYPLQATHHKVKQDHLHSHLLCNDINILVINTLG